MRVVICEFIDDGAAASLAARFEVVYDPVLGERAPELHRAIALADALIVRNRTTVDAALLAAAPRLKVVGRLGVGLDNIDLAACAARGIEVIAATGANARSVAEYVIATALMLRRDVYRASAAVAAGEWPRAALSRGHELAGSALGIVGFGSIGRLLAALSRALEVRVLAFDNAIGPQAPAWADCGAVFRPLDDLLREADIVSLHVPLAPDTRRLIDARRLALMKPDAILVNVARGAIVDEHALYRHLIAHPRFCAGIDAWWHEPKPRSPFRSDLPFLELPNVLGSPHNSAVVPGVLLGAARKAAQNVRQYLRGERVTGVMRSSDYQRSPGRP